MVASANAQISAIHAMLDNGHRSVRLERHTLPLWGITFGLLIAFIGRFFHGLYAEARWIGALAEHTTILIVVATVLTVDHRLTRAARRQRDETLSLVQRRLMQIVWLIVGLAVLTSAFAVVKLGGGRHVLGLDVAFAGVALFSVGLFADAWLRWSGVVLLGLGALLLLFVPADATLRWLTACTFAVGIPLIQWLSPWAVSTTRRVGATAVILLAILATGSLATALHYRLGVSGDGLPVVGPGDLASRDLQGEVVVALPAGAQVAVDFTLGGDWLHAPADARWQLELAKPLDVVLRDGRVTGRYRLDHGRWFDAREAIHAQQVRRNAILSPQQGLALQRGMTLAVDPGWPGLFY